MHARILNSFKILILLSIVMVPVAVLAQQITGSVRGTITGPSGDPVAGSSITVTDTRTGAVRKISTDNKGAFNLRGLSIGGPYTIAVDSDKYRGKMVTDVYTRLNGASVFNIALEELGALEEVVVVASSTVQLADLAIGPSSNFSSAQIEAMPTISRQIRDIIRLDPRVSIQRSNGGNGFGINCLGGSGRSNSFTIDGVRSADGFGLNSSGNAARNTFPVPFDAVRSASVEFSPVDVQYGQFTGCNINVVTKSGTNEFTGSVFYLYNDQSITGDSIGGGKVITAPFEDKDWGFDIGGPIIKDKLFFYFSYERTDEGGAQNTGPIGGGFANEGFITIEDANRVRDILRTKYGRDPGEIARTLAQGSKRKFVRLDWNISDKHRFEATYLKLNERNVEPDDLGFNGFSFIDNFEIEGTSTKTFSLRLFSHWDEHWSTEVRYSELNVNDLQDPVGGGEAQNSNKPRIIVQDGARDDILVSGPGFFRSANDLKYNLDQFKFAVNYATHGHTITAGYELDTLDVFNLFVANATGTITFATIADLDAGIASRINGNGSFTGNINDAAANFSRDIDTFYLQDEWLATERLTITAGLRYDTYSTGNRPIENPVWEQRYGFKNTQSFNGLDILLPRVGLTYDLPYDRFGDIQIRAGFGIFTGGDPTVHFANAFQNFGGAIGSGRASRSPCTAATLNVLSSGSFTGLPPCIVEQQIAQATQNTGRAAAVDPKFDLPSQRRWNIGASLFSESDIEFFNDWEVQLDYIYSNHKDSLDFIDLTLTQRIDANGNPVFLPDGRPQFFAVDPLRAGCNATLIGIRQGFQNVTSACNAGRDDEDILMTNGPSGNTKSFSAQASKSFTIGAKTSLDFRIGWAHTKARVANPVTSATATSSFEEVATAVINHPVLGPAFWANKDNIVVGANFRHSFIKDHVTAIGVFFHARSGRPFSYTYDNNTPTTLFGDSDNEERNLFYVPSGPDDPIVDFSVMDAQGTTQAFFAWLKKKGLDKFAGKISPKNGFEQPWNTDMDIRISQDIPLPGQRHNLKFTLDIENFLNFFSDGYNVQKFFSNGDVNEGLPVLDGALSADGTKFIYSNFAPGGRKSGPPAFNPLSFDVDDSVWRLQLGLRYEFN